MSSSSLTFFVPVLLVVPSLSFFWRSENEIIFPLSTAFPASHRRDGDDSGESFISRKHAHSLLK